jgi:serine protease Do
VEKVLPRLFEGGESSHPWLGLALQETDKGLEVTYALPGSPAERAGLQRGDLLLSLNGQAYSRIGDLQATLLDQDYPSLVRVEWSHEGQTASGLISLGKRPFSPIEEALQKDRRDNLLYPLFGMELEKTSQFLWKSTYVIRRVLPGSIADESGLSPDDPLTIQGWQVDEDNHVALLRIYVKKKKAGFLESIIQIGAYLETDKIV